MAKINYAFEKRQRELAKKKQKEQKQAKKRAGARSDGTAEVAEPVQATRPAS